MTLLLTFVLTLAVLQGARAPVNHAAHATCEIHGSVTEQGTRTPIGHALVQLHSGEPDRDELSAETDDQGRYEFVDVPPGTYHATALAGNFRGTYVAADMPMRKQDEPLLLRPGERRTNVDFELARASAIGVRVVDEWNIALATVHITATPAGAVTGGFSENRGTDDRGWVRLFGLIPGRYRICAEAPDRSMWMEPVSRNGFLRTCYPSTTSEADAELVEVGPSGPSEIQIQMRRGRMFTVSGIAIDASGNPVPEARIEFSTYTATSAASGGTATRADGQFTVGPVLPGDYGIEASFGANAFDEQRRAFQSVFQAVHVDAEDINGLVLAMVKGVDVAGRVTIDDSADKFPELPVGLTIWAVREDVTLPQMAGARSESVRGDRSFVLQGLTGPRKLDVVGLPRGWYVKSIRYGQLEIADVATEFKSDDRQLELVISRRGATVSGRATRDDGQPSIGGVAVMFSADPAHWNWSEPTTSRLSADGTFTLGPRRAGDYFVVALDSDQVVREGSTRELFARLARVAERITLTENEQRTLDLRIVHLK